MHLDLTVQFYFVFYQDDILEVHNEQLKQYKRRCCRHEA